MPINLALKPGFVDASLAPHYAEYVEVTEIREKSFTIKYLDEATRHGSTAEGVGVPSCAPEASSGVRRPGIANRSRGPEATFCVPATAAETTSPTDAL